MSRLEPGRSGPTRAADAAVPPHEGEGDFPSTATRSPSPSEDDGEETAEAVELTPEEERLAWVRDWLEEKEPEERAAMCWADMRRKAQAPPDKAQDGGPWRTWVFLGGRGAGKTRAGAEWVWDEALRLGRLTGGFGRIALVGATMHDVRSVMVEGPSGLMRLAHREGARLESSLRRIRFPGGCVAEMFSADEPDRLRGPQFHAAWGDEFCAWGRAEETLAMLRLGLRLKDGSRRTAQGGGGPRLMLTTTPRPIRLLRTVLAEPGCARTDAATRENADNLAPSFIEGIEALYGGTRRAAQELEGKILEPEGGLFRHEDIQAAKARWDRSPGRWEQVVVAVDPPAGTLSGEGGSACGIVVAGRSGDTCWVLADRSVRGLTANGWARRVRETAFQWGARRIVVEANQGGEMVQSLIENQGALSGCQVKRVVARWGKVVRAEPVAALYEQGRVGHAPGLEALEEELMGLGVEAGGESPDRADALVWAVTELMVGAAAQPRIRAG
jgi:phage terminase large subunit-like protein